MNNLSKWIWCGLIPLIFGGWSVAIIFGSVIIISIAVEVYKDKSGYNQIHSAYNEWKYFHNCKDTFGNQQNEVLQHHIDRFQRIGKNDWAERLKRMCQ